MPNSINLNREIGGRGPSTKVVRLHPGHLEDSALWDAFRSGDDMALVAIFDLYSQSLYNYGCKILNDRETVKDQVQDLFLELCRRRGSLGETNAIKFYLFKALRRRLARVKPEPPIPYLDSVPGNSSPEADLISKQTGEEQKRVLEHCLAKLTVRQREAIFLRYYEELPYDKIAHIMGLRKQSVYNLINESFTVLKESASRAIQNLR